MAHWHNFMLVMRMKKQSNIKPVQLAQLCLYHMKQEDLPLLHFEAVKPIAARVVMTFVAKLERDGNVLNHCMSTTVPTQSTVIDYAESLNIHAVQTTVAVLNTEKKNECDREGETLVVMNSHLKEIIF